MHCFLTFDGAPDSPHTEKVLDVLSAHGVKATFFVEGHRIPQGAALLGRIVAEGHGLGNHSYSHEIMLPMSLEETRAEVMLCEEKIYRAVGLRPTIVRPPWGKIRQDQARMLMDLGYEIICWNMSVRDWEASDSRQLAGRLVEYACPWMVPVMHDAVGVVPGALDLAIPVLREKGYSFFRVDAFV